MASGRIVEGSGSCSRGARSLDTSRSVVAAARDMCMLAFRDPQKHISISILWGYPYLIGLHYKGGLYGISLS